MSGGLSYLKKPTGILKIFELVCVVVAFGIFRGSHVAFGQDDDASYFGGGVLVTAMIVTPLLLVCYLMGRLEIQKTIFEMAFNCLMFILLFAAGAVAIDYWNDRIGGKKDDGLAMASFCIIASMAYLADAILAVIEYRK